MNEFLFYQILLAVLSVIAVVIFPTLLFIPAPYGRHVRPGWGIRIPSKLGWALMESPEIVVFALCFVFGSRRGGIVPLIFAVLWEVHYINRSLIYSMRIRTPSRKVPLSVLFMAILFSLSNGYLNGRWLYHFGPGYTVEWLWDPRFLLGSALFITGFIINNRSDGILRNLRQPGETGYKIPRGGLFELVSCANYFGEIVEWFGWALATWSPPGLIFALFTVANLVPRAHRHHKWYRSSFSDYPRNRKAVIPFIF